LTNSSPCLRTFLFVPFALIRQEDEAIKPRFSLAVQGATKTGQRVVYRLQLINVGRTATNVSLEFNPELVTRRLIRIPSMPQGGTHELELEFATNRGNESRMTIMTIFYADVLSRPGSAAIQIVEALDKDSLAFNEVAPTEA